MISLTSIAFGVSLVTASILTLHDTLKQVQHARGFATYLVTQDMHTNAKFAINCVASSIQERMTLRSQILKKSISSITNDFLQEINNFQEQIGKKIKKMSSQSLIGSVREQQIKINEQAALLNSQQQIDGQSWYSKLFNYKNLIYNQINKQFQIYNSARRAKQWKIMYHLFDIYKENNGIRNDKWITPYNIIILILLGIGSFFVPKLTIALALSYFISSELYLLSDTLAAATKWQGFQKIKFQYIFQFHLTILSSFVGWDLYKIYKKHNTDKIGVQKSISNAYSQF